MKNRTKILWTMLSIVTLLAGIAAFSYSYNGRGHGGRGMGYGHAGRGGMGLGILRYHSDPALRLTEEQNTKIDKIRLANMEKMWQLRRELDRLYNSNASAEKIESIQKQMFNLRDKMWKETLSVLTAKQKQEIEQYQNSGRNSRRGGYGRGPGSGDCPGFGSGRGYGRGNGMQRGN